MRRQVRVIAVEAFVDAPAHRVQDGPGSSVAGGVPRSACARSGWRRPSVTRGAARRLRYEAAPTARTVVRREWSRRNW